MKSKKAKLIFLILSISFVVLLSYGLYIRNYNYKKYEFQVDKQLVEVTTGRAEFVPISMINGDPINFLDYEYTSSDESVLKVTKEGKIIAIKEGEAIVIIKSKNSSQKLQVKVHVNSDNSAPTNDFSLSVSSVKLSIGKKYIVRTSLESNDVTWKSSNEEIASVKDGEITAKNEGSCVITATHYEVSKEVLVEVKNNSVEIESIKFNESEVTIIEKETLNLNYTITPPNANENLNWESSDPSIATVSNGIITGVSEGKCTITATSNNKKAQINVTVTKNAIDLADIFFETTTRNLSAGDKYTIPVAYKPRNATNKRLTWKSSNTNVATVSNGVVTAKANGTSTITATSYNGKKATMTITVRNRTITVTFYKNADREDTTTLTQNFMLGVAGNKFGYNTNGTLKWENSGQFGQWDRKGYKLLGWALNKTDTKAKYSVYSSVADNWINNVYEKKYSQQTSAQKINLYAVWEVIPIKSIALDKTSTTIGIGETITPKVIVKPDNALTGSYTWTSSNPKVATVNSNGKIKGVAEGTCTITAKSSNGKTAKIIVIVKKQITVVFHRNTGDNDTTKATQYFTKGESKNRFGYNTNGTLKWGNSGQFGQWDFNGHTLKGWSRTKGSKKVDYPVYSGVSDKWIDSVTKNFKGKIDLYAVWYENVDLVLFWGQSNMVGSVGIRAGEKVHDSRNITGLIDSEIISQYKTYGYTSVQVPSKVGYEYKISKEGDGYLKEITPKTGTSSHLLGETLMYTNGKFITKTSKPYSLGRSHGTNMIPQFVKTYYERTGHKTIAVQAAHGGTAIAEFLPGHKDGQNIYEALVAKYNGAANYLQNNGYEIKNKFYIVYQGCADIKRTNEYYNTYMKVHNNMKKDLGIKFGAIVYIGHNLKDKETKLSYVQLLHKEQEKLVKNNADIILATDFVYKAYINNKANIFSDVEDNSIHVTSAGLSQVGKNTANNIANSGKVK